MSNTVFPAQVRGLGYTVVKSPEDSVLKQQAPSWEQTRIIQSLNPIWHWNLLYDFLIDNPLKPNAAFAYTDLQTLLGFVTARRNSWDDFLFLDPDDNYFGPGLITQGWLPNYPFSLYSVIIASGHAQQLVTTAPGAKSGYSTPVFSTAGGTATDGAANVWQDLGAAVAGGTAWPNPFAKLQVVTDGTTYYSPLQLLRGGQSYYEDIFDLAGGITVYENGVVSSNYSLQFGGISIPNFSSAGLYLVWNSPPTQPVTATFNYYYRVHFEDDTQDFEKWANQWWTVGGSEGSKGKGELKLTTSRVPNGSIGLPGASPAPPLAFPAGATQFIVIYPSTVTLSYGSGPGTTTGIAFGQANGTANSWFNVHLYTNGLGSVGGSAVFSGFSLPPWLPPSVVKAIYAYTTWNSVLTTGTTTDYGQFGISGGALATLYGIIARSGLQMNLTRVDTLGGVPPIAQFPYNAAQLIYFQGALIHTQNNDLYAGRPALVVYY